MSSFTRRTLFAGSALTAATLAGCTFGSGEELVLYASTPTDQVDLFTDSFQTATDLETDIITGGTGDLLSRVKAEKGRPQGDILWGGSSTTGGSAPDLFEKYTPDDSVQISEQFLDPNGYNAPLDAFTMVIVYNKDMVKGDDIPQAWADLTADKWREKIHYANPASSSSSFVALVNWKLIGGWDLIEQLIPNFVIDDSSSKPFTAVGQGESPLAVAYEEGAHRWAESGKVGIVYPEDGVTVVPGGMFQIKDSENPESAKKFLDFALAPEQQQQMVDEFPGRRPTSEQVDLPEAMPSLQELNVLDYPTDEAAEKQDEWLNKWTEMLSSSK